MPRYRQNFRDNPKLGDGNRSIQALTYARLYDFRDNPKLGDGNFCCSNVNSMIIAYFRNSPKLGDGNKQAMLYTFTSTISEITPI